MRRQGFAILGVVMLALFSVACGESDLGLTTKVKSRLSTARELTRLKSRRRSRVRVTRGTIAAMVLQIATTSAPQTAQSHTGRA